MALTIKSASHNVSFYNSAAEYILPVHENYKVQIPWRQSFRFVLFASFHRITITLVIVWQLSGFKVAKKCVLQVDKSGFTV